MVTVWGLIQNRLVQPHADDYHSRPASPDDACKRALSHEQKPVSASTTVGEVELSTGLRRRRSRSILSSLCHGYYGTGRARLSFLPMDDMDRECPGFPLRRKIEPRLSGGKDVLQPVAEALEASKRPLLVIGGALDQAEGWYDGIALAEKLNAAVMMPPYEGRPGFPATHPLFQGGLLSGASLICKQRQGYDLVVVIGAPVFRYYPYAPGAYLPEGTRLILLTDSTEEVARAVAGDGIVCDPARACATLVECSERRPAKLPSPAIRFLLQR